MNNMSSFSKKNLPMSLRTSVFLTVILSLFFVAAGVFYFHVEKGRLLDDKYGEIAAVAAIKAREIEQWRTERLEDAHELARDPLLSSAFLRWMTSRENGQLKAEIEKALVLEKRLTLYSDAFIADLNGRSIMSIGSGKREIVRSEKSAFETTVRNHYPVLGDFFRNIRGRISIDAMDAILNRSGKAVAVVVLRSKADNFILPLLSSWPSATRTERTLLAEKQGDTILVLNPRASVSSGPVGRSVSPTDTALPCVQAVLGRVGLFKGKNFLGKNVLAALQPVFGSRWFVVTEIDNEELISEVNARGGVVAVIVFLLIGLSVGTTAYIYRHNQAAVYRDLYESESERRRAMEMAAKLAAIVESSDDAIIGKTTEGIVTSWNRAAERIYGYSAEEMLGHPIAVLEVPGHEDEFPDIMRRIREGEHVGHYETVRRKKDGALISVSLTVSPIYDSDSNIVGASVVSRDVTKWKLTEDALRESEERFRKAFENSSIGMAITDLEGHFTKVNGALCKTLGYDQEELLRIHFTDLTAPGEVEMSMRLLKQVLDGEMDSVKFEKRYIRRDGQFIWVVVNSSLVRDASGKPVYFISLYQDVTGEHNALIRLGRSESRFRVLVEQSLMGVFVISSGRFIYVNPRFAELFGYTAEEIVEEYVLTDLVAHEKPGAGSEEILERLLGEGASYQPNRPLKGKRKDGQFIWVEVLGKRTDWEGQSAVLGTCLNVTERELAEESLRISEERFRTLVEESGAGMLIYSEEGIAYVNDSAAALSGYSRKEIAHLSLDDIIHPDYLPALREMMRRRLSGERLEAMGEFPFVAKSGETKWVASSGSRIIYDGKPAVIAMLIDITYRREAEENMRLQLAAMEAAADAIVITDRKGNIQFANKAFTNLTGYAVGEVKGKNPRILKSGEQDECFYRNLWNTINSGNIWRGELVNKRKDDSFYHESMSITPVPDKSGNLTNFIAVKRDITEQKRAENSLRESEEKFRAFVEGSASAIWIHDGKHFLYANPAALQMTGYTLDELMRIDYMEIYLPDSRALLSDKIERRLKGEEVNRHFEEQIVSKSGQSIWVDFSVALIEYQGKQAILTSVFDISERKKLEEQLMQSQKMEGIGRLAGGIAHDYNNMLGVILGYTQLILKKRDGSDPVSRYVELIDSAARRGAELTRQLLAFARREIVSPKPIDPNAAILSLQKMLTKLIGEDVALRFVPGRDIWHTLIDPTQFDQILLNLASNSRDAIGGVGNVVIETSNVTIGGAESDNKSTLAPGEYIMLTFSDDGIGMDKETANKIFEPFFTTKPKGEGTGLGLSTVYGIVRQNGGIINVYSEKGHGTTFKMYLPRHYGRIENITPEADNIDLHGSETILVVEDQADLLELARLSLEQYGYRVLTAPTPDDGMTIVENYNDEIDLLLTDVIMPEMNGRELRDRVLMRRSDIKVVFMSGYTADIIAHRGFIDKEVDFIPKPFTPSGLAKKIREALDS